MLSYKEYKMLNESLYGCTTLGLAKPATVGVMGAVAGEQEIEEGKMKKKMLGDIENKDDLEAEIDPEDDADIDAEDGDDGKECGDDAEMEFCNKKMKKNAKKNMKAEVIAPSKRPEMSEEEQLWWSSVHDMLDFNPTNKNWDGIAVQEDALIEPPVSEEPQAGEVGFAPQGRVGFTPADPGWKYNS